MIDLRGNRASGYQSARNNFRSNLIMKTESPEKEANYFSRQELE